MFKFMKSKKGFTLVELMIVVVIMAILVAVAVPIYSAVTKNAQLKTCNSNIREIVSQISNYCMAGNTDGSVINEDATIVIEYANDEGTVDSSTGTKLTKDVVTTMFQEVPYCPAEGDYTIYVAKSTTGATPTINVNCSAGGDHQTYTAS